MNCGESNQVNSFIVLKKMHRSQSIKHGVHTKLITT